MCGLSPCVVVQLKKEVQAAHINQGLCELVLANVRSPSLFPIVVLTDLQSCWQLMWMNGPVIFTAKPDASTAISIIRLLVQQVRWSCFVSPLILSEPVSGLTSLVMPLVAG